MLDVVLDVVLDAGSLLGIWDWNAREMEEGHHNLSFCNFEGIFVSLACDLSVCSSNPGLDVKEMPLCVYNEWVINNFDCSCPASRYHIHNHHMLWILLVYNHHNAPECAQGTKSH